MISLDRRTCLAASLALAACNLGYAATTWPVKPVRLTVPAAAGTAPDIKARLIDEKLGAIWGQTEFGSYGTTERVRWEKVLRDVGAAGDDAVTTARLNPLSVPSHIKGIYP
jgi:hypothetical protein